MIYTKCDINKHNLYEIAELAYITEPDLSMMLFGKNKEKAKRRIVKLIKNKSNSFSCKNIFLAFENNNVLGIIVGYSGNEINKEKENKAISETLDFLGVLRLIIYDKLLVRRILTTKIAPDDFYISVICVNNKHRRRGIGENLLNNAKIIAKEKKCTRIILDVSKENKNAISFYKKNGFKIYDEVNTRLFLHKINVLKMELNL